MAWLNSWLVFWWRLLGKSSSNVIRVVDDQAEHMADSLAGEIRQAHREWLYAQYLFEMAVGKDQIDYAIYAIEAAEKRYEMLLRSAKKLPVVWHAQRGVSAG